MSFKITSCNIPTVKLGIVAVSRDCFPAKLSEKRRTAIVSSLKTKAVDIYESKIILENEIDAMKALDDVKANGVNALVIYLGNFGPEGPETLLAQKFGSPVMFVAAGEETKDDMINGRGDAYCGMLSMSCTAALRNISDSIYIPEYPVGSADEVADMIADFKVIARAYIGIKGLKIIGFGPRPHDFFACNAPIAPLFKLGVEIQENSELDLFEAFEKRSNDPRIAGIVKEIETDLSDTDVKFPKVIPMLAQYELTLRDWQEKNTGASNYIAFANKCWPAFQTKFHFVPCYVNSRFAARGIPIACETDIYGALTEYILTCITEESVTLLDINNTVPRDLYDTHKKIVGDYKLNDLFMGFHCGNTPVCRLKKSTLSNQLIMKRLLEPNGEPYMSRGTLEGNIAASDITFFRLQSSKDGELRSYIAEGETLDIPSMSFGGIGVMGIKEMARFYRHVLIQKQFPHHGGVGFMKCGKYLFELMKMIGVTDVSFNQPAGMLYKTENPFC